MGKSYKKNNHSENNHKNNSSDYKRRKNQIKEDYLHDDLSEYRIHGFKKKSD